jgi:predicted DNA-binding transcriptional regulator YafY
MPGDRVTLHRHWELLRLIPREPRKKSAGELWGALDRRGFRVSKRTIERDLVMLSEQFALIEDTRNKPYGWSWLKNAPLLDVPGLTLPQALAFAMIERYLRPLLPDSVLAELKPHFDLAGKALQVSSRPRGMPSWVRKIRVVTPTQSLLVPKINLAAQRAD